MLGLNWADPRPIWVSQVAGDVRSWISQDDPSSLVLRNLGVGGRGNRRERGGLLRRGWCGGGGGAAKDHQNSVSSSDTANAIGSGY